MVSSSKRLGWIGCGAAAGCGSQWFPRGINSAVIAASAGSVLSLFLLGGKKQQCHRVPRRQQVCNLAGNQSELSRSEAAAANRSLAEIDPSDVFPRALLSGSYDRRAQLSGFRVEVTVLATPTAHAHTRTRARQRPTLSFTASSSGMFLLTRTNQ